MRRDRFSVATLAVLRHLWFMPWASAGDIARVCDSKEPAVANVLRRCVANGLLFTVQMGRVRRAVQRYGFSFAGVSEFEERPEFPRHWWHSEKGLEALAKRLQILEVVYEVMPRLWQSNLVADSLIRSPLERGLVRIVDYRKSRLTGLWWLRHGPFDAVALYESEGWPGVKLFLPVAWRGSFHGGAELSSWLREMDRVLEAHPGWGTLELRDDTWRPGMVLVCPDRLVGVKVGRELDRRAEPVEMAMVDEQGQVVRPMGKITAAAYTASLPVVDTALGEPQRVKNGLEAGPFAAVNGTRAWRVLRWIAGFPGSDPEQVMEANGLSRRDGAQILAKMKTQKVVSQLDGAYYLESRGRGLLAAAERVTPERVLKRLGAYTKPDGSYRMKVQRHNKGVAQTAIAFLRQDLPVFSGLGMVIDYQRLQIRASPDAYTILPPGVLVSIEYERTATSAREAATKAGRYRNLDEAGVAIPVLFVTPTEAAARHFVELRWDHLLATTLDRAETGPYGKAFIGADGVVWGTAGVWGYWYRNRESPTFDAAVDLWPKLKTYPKWRVPLEQRFREIERVYLYERPDWEEMNREYEALVP